jgi:hypothetical protein
MGNTTTTELRMTHSPDTISERGLHERKMPSRSGERQSIGICIRQEQTDPL